MFFLFVRIKIEHPFCSFGMFDRDKGVRWKDHDNKNPFDSDPSCDFGIREGFFIAFYFTVSGRFFFLAR